MKRVVIPLAAGLLFTSCAQHNQKASLKTPSTPSAMERQILNAVDAGDGDVDLRTRRALVISEPTNLQARLDLGNAYERRGYPELALDHYRFAAEHSPESAEAHLLLARAMDLTGHSAEAIKQLSVFLEEHPQPGPTLYSWLGIMRDNVEDWKGSEKSYREALAKAAENHDYLNNNLGYSLLKQGRIEEAAVEFRAALKLNPRSEIARDNLGIALAYNPGAENRKEAILNWQSINEPAVAHSNMAAVLIEQGKLADARKELEVALQYNQTNPAALKNLELLSTMDGKPVTVPVGDHRGYWSRIGGWTRVKTAWTICRRWFGRGSGNGARQTTETATGLTPAISTPTGSTPTTSESKQ